MSAHLDVSSARTSLMLGRARCRLYAFRSAIRCRGQSWGMFMYAWCHCDSCMLCVICSGFSSDVESSMMYVSLYVMCYVFRASIWCRGKPDGCLAYMLCVICFGLRSDVGASPRNDYMLMFMCLCYMLVDMRYVCQTLAWCRGKPDTRRGPMPNTV